MTPLPERKGSLIVPLVGAAAALTIVALSPLSGRGGSLLLALLFWIAVIEGCVAAAAAGTLVNARGLGSVTKELLSVRPLLLLLSFLLLLLIPFTDSYPWARSPGIWLRKEFFIGRNVAFLLLAWAAAEWLAASPAGNGGARIHPLRIGTEDPSSEGPPTEQGGKARATASATGPEAAPGARTSRSEREGARNVRAAAYLFVFVVSQSLAAFDLVMSLEYPWYSTLFGGYFFIEALYAGFCVAAVLCILVHGKPPRTDDPETPSFLSDISVVMFGFGLLWAGLFFAQYLTIWYGNIPEEVSFIAKRAKASPYRELGVAVLFLLFFLPFPSLLSTRAKSNPYVVTAVSLSILSGILVERYVFVAPVVPPGPGTLAIDFLCLLVPFALVVYRRTGRMRRPG